MINFTRYSGTGAGVCGPRSMTALSGPSRFGRDKNPSERQKLKIGVENEYLDQIMGRQADLCRA
jgi:hypothetical protein